MKPTFFWAFGITPCGHRRLLDEFAQICCRRAQVVPRERSGDPARSIADPACVVIPSFPRLQSRCSRRRSWIMVGLRCAGALMATCVCPIAWSQSPAFVIDNHHLQADPADPNVNITVGVSVGGGPLHDAQVDTGSVGVLTSRDMLGPKAVALGESGAREFNSSGRIYQGNYYRAPIELRGVNGNATTLPIRVLAVDTLVCDPQRAHNCQPTLHVSNFVFLGVGFDRPPFLNPPYVTRDALGPFDNPFLQLEAMASGTMPRRYILTRDHVALGPGDAEDANFKLCSLPGKSGLGGTTAPYDWNTARADYTLRGSMAGEVFAPPGGSVPLLIDTGLDDAILTVPPALRPSGLTSPDSTTLKEGIDVEVNVPACNDSTESVLHYEFRTGASPAPTYAPTRVLWGVNGESTQLNTGGNILNEYDYLYDSDHGAIGFRPH
jgi:hypothetical protein